MEEVFDFGETLVLAVAERVGHDDVADEVAHRLFGGPADERSGLAIDDPKLDAGEDAEVIKMFEVERAQRLVRSERGAGNRRLRIDVDPFSQLRDVALTEIVAGELQRAELAREIDEPGLDAGRVGEEIIDERPVLEAAALADQALIGLVG